MTPKPNVLIIVFDALRGDVRIPALQQLAKQGCTFPHALSAGTATCFSVAGMLFGGKDLLVYHQGKWKMAPQALSLAEVLRVSHETAFITGNFLLSKFEMLHRGFDYVHTPKLTGIFCPEEGAQVLEHARTWKKQVDPREPWFCYLHFFEPHAPYTTPLPDIEPPTERVAGGWTQDDMTPEEYTYLHQRYTHHAQVTVPPLLEQALTLADENTIIVVTSDHGQAFGEKGMIEHVNAHGPNIQEGVPRWDLLWQIPAVRSVPLIIVGPGISPAVDLTSVCTAWLGAYITAYLGQPPSEDDLVAEKLRDLGYIA